MELLVCLAVCLILASVLLPGLLRAKKLAQTTRCQQNQRQIIFAASLYWSDFEGRTFPERLARRSDGWIYWFGWLGDGQEGQREFDPTLSPLWPYLETQAVGLCPSLDPSKTWFKSKARGAAFGYAYNLLLGPRNRSTINMRLLNNPTETAVFTDAAQINTFQPPASPDNPMLEEFYYFGTNRIEATVHFRHQHRAMTAFADGHTAGITPELGSLDGRLSHERIGRLPTSLVVPH